MLKELVSQIPDLVHLSSTVDTVRLMSELGEVERGKKPEVVAQVNRTLAGRTYAPAALHPESPFPSAGL